MTEETIKETLDAIRKTTARVTKSKATDIKFLVSAGIIKPDNGKQQLSKTLKAKK